MKTFIYTFFLFLSVSGYCQVGITTPITTPPTPNPLTELDVESLNSNTGILIPSFTDATIVSNLNAYVPKPSHGMLIYNSTKNKFMFNAGDNTTPIWSFVGSIPVISNHTTIGTPVEGEIMYDKNDGNIWYYGGIPVQWRKLMP